MRRLVRSLGTLLVAAGLLTLLWVFVVWRWEDPFTAIYTHVEQSRLSHAYNRNVAAFSSSDAATYEHSLRPGDPVGNR